MKTIIILHCFLYAFVVNVYAQIKEPKFISGKPILGKAVTFNTTKVLNTKLAWSHIKDKQGNMYKVYAPKTSFSTPPFKIFKYTATGENYLYFNSAGNNIGYETSTTGMKYAFDDEANFYWQNGNQFFKLSNDGIIKKVNGEATSNINTMQDGLNATTTGRLLHFKYNPYDGYIYFTEKIYNQDGIYLNKKLIKDVTDMVFLRKMSTTGEITTCRYSNGDLFLENLTNIFFAPNGDIIYTKAATAFGSRADDIYRWDMKNKPTAVVKFHGGLFTGIKGDKGRWTLGDTSIARVTASVEQIIVNSKTELIIYDGNVGRFAKVSGSIVTAYSGTSNMQKIIEGITLAAESKDMDGSAATAQYKSVGPLTIDKEDNIYFASKIGVRKVAPNGNVTTIIKPTQKQTIKTTDDEN